MGEKGEERGAESERKGADGKMKQGILKEEKE